MCCQSDGVNLQSQKDQRADSLHTNTNSRSLTALHTQTSKQDPWACFTSVCPVQRSPNTAASVQIFLVAEEKKKYTLAVKILPLFIGPHKIKELGSQKIKARLNDRVGTDQVEAENVAKEKKLEGRLWSDWKACEG